jgi:hypothetical protein
MSATSGRLDTMGWDVSRHLQQHQHAGLDERWYQYRFRRSDTLLATTIIIQAQYVPEEENPDFSYVWRWILVSALNLL